MTKALPVLLLLLSACAPQPVAVSVPGLERSAGVQVRDLRPEAEKQAETFSIAVTSDAYALYRLADNRKQFEALAGREEYKRAFYTAQENPGRGSVVIVYMETEIGGKRTFTRSMGPWQRDGKDALAGTVESAIRFHLAQYP